MPFCVVRFSILLMELSLRWAPAATPRLRPFLHLRGDQEGPESFLGTPTLNIPKSERQLL